MGDIEILEVDQGTKEWHRLRAGCITASNFAEIQKVVGGLDDRQRRYVDAVLAGSDQKEAAEAAGFKAPPRAEVVRRALDGEQVGDWSSAAHDYAFQLAIERISGEPLDEGFQTWAMARGHELEPEARAEHAIKINERIEKAGFVRTADGKFGASADGLIAADGGAEYKCFIDPTKLRSIIIARDISDFIAQCQVGLWLTGRIYWHFCLYCPALGDKALTVHRIKRDEDAIEQLQDVGIRFDALVETYRQKISSHKTMVGFEPEPKAVKQEMEAEGAA